jgi:hypothetical protein
MTSFVLMLSILGPMPEPPCAPSPPVELARGVRVIAREEPARDEPRCVVPTWLAPTEDPRPPAR